MGNDLIFVTIFQMGWFNHHLVNHVLHQCIIKTERYMCFHHRWIEFLPFKGLDISQKKRFLLQRFFRQSNWLHPICMFFLHKPRTFSRNPGRVRGQWSNRWPCFWPEKLWTKTSEYIHIKLINLILDKFWPEKIFRVYRNLQLIFNQIQQRHAKQEKCAAFAEFLIKVICTTWRSWSSTRPDLALTISPQVCMMTIKYW